MAAFITGCGFPGHISIKDLLPATTVRLKLYHIVDGISYQIPVILLFEKSWPLQAQANRRKLRIREGMRPGSFAGYFGTDADFIFCARYPLNVILSLRPWAKLPRDAAVR